MVDREYIEKNIDIIFDFEIRNLKNNNLFHYVQTFKEINVITNDGSEPIRYPSGRRPLMDLELNSEDSFDLEWDTYRYLKKLYTKVEHFPGCRNIFLSTLEKKLSNSIAIDVPISIKVVDTVYTSYELHSNSSLAFYFLLKTGRNDAIIRVLKAKMKESKYLDTYTDSGENIEFETYKCINEIEGLFNDILIFMHVEPVYFDESLLDVLIEIANCNFPRSLNIREKFKDKIITLKYNRLKTQLETFNEELNIHKEQLIGIISKYGFPSEMEKFLLEIDEVPELSNWQSVNSGMIGNLRSFFETLVKSIAKKILAKTGEKYPQDSSKGELGNKRTYIKKHLILSDNDDKLITSFINILHQEGGHAFTSEKKYFVMTKNIGIEIAYFLLSTYEEKFETSS
jgi:hypothetical protein